MTRKMKPYGMGRGDFPWCCPGHDDFSSECYNSNRSKRAHTKMTKVLHRRGRRKEKLNLNRQIRCEEI